MQIMPIAFTTEPRARTAQALLGRGCATSVQALHEFTNVARRKLDMTWREVHDALGAVRTLCRSILPVDLETHADALRIAERYGYAIFDALMIAAALRARCTVLYSEVCTTAWQSTGDCVSSIRIAIRKPCARARCRPERS